MVSASFTPQRPIGSGFDAHTTAADALAGLDLTGRLAVVTGGSSGLGLETVRALTGAGAEVVVPARRPAHATQALAAAGIAAEVDALDLGDLDSVGAFAQRFLAAGRPLDILINNAAIMANPETRVGPDGWESQFATNHLGHFALTALLWPALTQAPDGARVIALTSNGHKLAALAGRLSTDDPPAGIAFDDVMFTRRPYDKWLAYGQAKTANSLFAVALDDRGRDAGVRAFAVHPGGILTPLQRHIDAEEGQRYGWYGADGAPRTERFKTPEQGAATTVWAATAPALAGLGGVYCEDCDIALPTAEVEPARAVGSGVDAHAIDREIAARLWALSVELTA
ncbi:FabG-like 3-oxoacyl-(acyl-carrier-protein) reductase [Baekduia alba]|uniref:oxidoreductase n=1 Tax=Baekduia alba TaxID=2997333 RepID=UPI002341AFC8|nr:oxidoreductase [Baekduia alba]WCB94972.1 FabG-like 3-oxoacyl-(acyl-carrier-protein) reductase [Baekduia alba]